jgi:fido (protein-threonine AMPylation protein)
VTPRDPHLDALEGAGTARALQYAEDNLLHHRFECIHPFQDGNGRTGRVLVTWMFRHYGLPPFDLPEGRRSEYIEAMEAADAQFQTQDLDYVDYYPRQLTALDPLVELMSSALAELPDEPSS